MERELQVEDRYKALLNIKLHFYILQQCTHDSESANCGTPVAQNAVAQNRDFVVTYVGHSFLKSMFRYFFRFKTIGYS